MTLSSKSQSEKTRFGDLPPNSKVTLFTESAAFFETKTPARVEPVNETISTSLCLESNVPTVGPSPFIKLKAPGG